MINISRTLCMQVNYMCSLRFMIFLMCYVAIHKPAVGGNSQLFNDFHKRKRIDTGFMVGRGLACWITQIHLRNWNVCQSTEVKMDLVLLPCHKKRY